MSEGFLKGCEGWLQTDGWKPYYGLGPQACNVACLAHVRRELTEIVKACDGDLKVMRSGPVALETRRHIDEIFCAGRVLAVLDPEERICKLEELESLLSPHGSWL